MSHHEKSETKKRKKESFFKKKSIIAIFALISLFSGTFFIDRPITGNVILDNYHSIHSVSIIGMTLIFCSVVLMGYYVYKSL